MDNIKEYHVMSAIILAILVITVVFLLTSGCAKLNKRPVAVIKVTSTKMIAATDYTCVRDCVSKGYLYAYCESECSW